MPALAFYLGAHQPHWLWRAGFPLFVSHRQLARRRSLRPASCRWALDSGGFTELSMHGRWVTPAEAYAEASPATPSGSAGWTSPPPKTGCASRSCSPAPAFRCASTSTAPWPAT